MEYLIRRAEVADAPGACEAVRQSIAELCIEDHHGDQATIAAWLSNKTIENVASWIALPRNIAAVAQSSIGIVGFGLLRNVDSLRCNFLLSPTLREEGRSCLQVLQLI